MRGLLPAIGVLAACVACGAGGGSTSATGTSAATGIGAAIGAGTVAVVAPAVGAAASSTPLACPSVFAPGVIVLFEPSPNSIGVNIAQNNVVFIDTPAAAPRSGWEWLTLNGIAQGVLAPAAIPSPLPANEAFLSAPITTPLKAQTTYNVAVAFINGCGSPDTLAVGTFTTQ